MRSFVRSIYTRDLHATRARVETHLNTKRMLKFAKFQCVCVCVCLCACNSNANLTYLDKSVGLI